MTRWIFPLLALLLATSVAGAQERVGPTGGTPAQSTFPVEGYMFLTGQLASDATGKVYWHEIDSAQDVPEQVRSFIAQQAADWTLEETTGTPVARTMTFALAVRASPAGDGLFRLWLAGINVREVLPPAERIVVDRRIPPEYPYELARIGAGGIVYMSVWVDADGNVQDLFAGQVDLTTMPQDLEQMKQIQAKLAANAAAAVRRWRFRMPAMGKDAGRPFAAQVTVDFTMEKRLPVYGEWRYLVRGRRALPPWQSTSGALETMVPGEIQLAGSGYRIRSTGLTEAGS